MIVAATLTRSRRFAGVYHAELEAGVTRCGVPINLALRMGDDEARAQKLRQCRRCWREASS